MKITIKNDVFNIFKRIKTINCNFSIFFNTNNKKYEVYENGSLIFTLPFKYLDSRSLDYIRKMLKTSNEEIVKEVELHNQRQEKEINEKLIASAIESAERVLKRS